MFVIVGTLTLEVGRKMNDYESNHRSGFDCCIGGMYDSGSAGTRRTRHADVLRQGHSQGMYGPDRLAHQKRISFLFLQLAQILVLAGFLFGCTSAGTPLPADRDEQLVCQSHEAKICSATGAASRIKDNTGSCYCAPVEQMQNQ
jgi:hypothetical protein